jgi:hypothetical protein
MSDIMESNYAQIKSYVERNKFSFDEKGVLLANMGQFVKYVEDMYELVGYYSINQVQF